MGEPRPRSSGVLSMSANRRKSYLAVDDEKQNIVVSARGVLRCSDISIFYFTAPSLPSIGNFHDLAESVPYMQHHLLMNKSSLCPLYC